MSVQMIRPCRRALIGGLSAAHFMAGPASATNRASGGLAAIAAAKGITFGCAVRSGALIADSGYRALVQRECMIVTPEAELKWASVAPTKGRYNFSRAEIIAGLSGTSSRLRGHALLWHNAIPAWALNALEGEQAEHILGAHIKTMIRHWSGRIESWDVVNEAIDVGQSDGLRKSVFYRKMGARYVDEAFRLAREAGPTEVLVYNDYGFEADNDEAQRKRNYLLSFIRGLRARNAPIDAVGLQTHLRLEDPFNQSKYAQFISDLAGTGVDVFITELDISDQSNMSVKKRDRALADRVGAVLDAALSTPALKSIVLWSLTDRYSWLNEWGEYFRKDFLSARGSIFDERLEKKPLYEAVRRSISVASDR